MDPDTWHMSLVTIALPYNDRMMTLYNSKEQKDQNMLVAENRKYAQKALLDFATIVGNYA